MPWTLRDLMSEATSIAQTTGDGVQPSRVSFYVNQAQRDIANRVQQVEYERLAVSSTSSGEDKMFLPADCERLLALSFDTGVSGIGGRGLQQANLWQMDSQSQGTQTGVPQYYLSYATWVQLYPSPNSQYSLLMRYVARMSDMTDLDAVPSVDTRYHTAVLYRTVEHLALRKGNAEQAALMRGFYERELVAQPSAAAQRQQNRSGMAARVQLTAD